MRRKVRLRRPASIEASDRASLYEWIRRYLGEHARRKYQPLLELVGVQDATALIRLWSSSDKDGFAAYASGLIGRWRSSGFDRQADRAERAMNGVLQEGDEEKPVFPARKEVKVPGLLTAREAATLIAVIFDGLVAILTHQGPDWKEKRGVVVRLPGGHGSWTMRRSSHTTRRLPDGRSVTVGSRMRIHWTTGLCERKAIDKWGG
jgi:hypothetical protein